MTIKSYPRFIAKLGVFVVGAIATSWVAGKIGGIIGNWVSEEIEVG